MNTGTDVQINAVSFANGMFVGGGYSPLLGTNYIVSSINGTNWARSSSATLDPMTGFASDGHKFVAVGRSLLGIPGSPGNPRTRSTAWVSDSVIDVEVEPGNAGHLSISGIIGRSYQLEYVDALATSGSNNWQTLTNFALPSSPYTWTDPTSTNSSQRLYRAVLLP